MPVTWSLGPGARGTITSAGLYRAPATGAVEDKVIASRAAGGTCAALTGHGYVRSGPTVPSAPRSVSVSAPKIAGDRVVQWLAPAQTSGLTPTYEIIVCGDEPVDGQWCERVGSTTALTFTYKPDQSDDAAFERIAVIARNTEGIGPQSHYLEFN